MEAALTRKLTDAIDLLAHGVEVEKYCYGRQKVEKAKIFFSEDAQSMGIYILAKQRVDIVSMTECMNITTGLKTSRFQ